MNQCANAQQGVHLNAVIRHSSACSLNVQSHDLFDVPRQNENYSNLSKRLFAGVSAYGVTEDFAQKVLSQVSRQDLADFLQSLMLDEESLNQLAQRSYYHPNGFLKLQLVVRDGVKVRLHYWSKDLNSAEENVHNHRWRLASKVMHGKLRSELFSPVETQGQVNTDLDFEQEQLTLRMYRKNLGDHAAQGEVYGDYAVQKTNEIIRNQGAVYAMDTNELHRIVHHQGQATMTLMVQSTPLYKDNHMLSRKNVRNPELEPVCIQSAEKLKPLLQELIDLLK